MKHRSRAVYRAALGLLGLSVGVMGSAEALAASFVFGTAAGGQTNQVIGQTTATQTDAGVTATFTAGPAGAVLDDRSSGGLGVNSRGLATSAVSDPEIDKLNLLGSLPGGFTPLDGTGESISFSFDQPGAITSLLFDGMKDETLEYFVLTLPNGGVITIFDSQAEFRLGIQGFSLADLNVINPVEAQLEDDDLTGLNLGYNAGDVFTLTYGESDYIEIPGYEPFPGEPIEFGNGARFQGVVTAVPEPGAAVLLLSLGSLAALRRRA